MSLYQNLKNWNTIDDEQVNQTKDIIWNKYNDILNTYITRENLKLFVANKTFDENNMSRTGCFAPPTNSIYIEIYGTDLSAFVGTDNNLYQQETGLFDKWIPKNEYEKIKEEYFNF